jgi:glutamate 5-kinase
MSTDAAHSRLCQARRWVIKVGSSLVTNDGRGLDEVAIGRWCEQLAALARDGREVLMVSSGAVAEGMRRLGWPRRPSELPELQAAAAVGQMGLAHMYESKLRSHQLASAQVLLTHGDVADRERYLNVRSTLLTLLRLGVVPVINENDTVVNDEIKFGDNDTLAALVASVVEADALVILTDQQGLYTTDPRHDPNAVLLTQGQAGDPALEAMAGGAGSLIGKGGMITKVLAAKRAALVGATTIIASGRQDDVLPRLARGEAMGTCLAPTAGKGQARKRWMANQLQIPGYVTVDDGAVSKLVREGKSLLPIGMTAVYGEFARGDVIGICDQHNREVARGLANYPSGEARRLCGTASSRIAQVLGYVAEPEMVHRTNLVLMR